MSWRHLHPDQIAERDRQLAEQQSERDEIRERQARHAPAPALRSRAPVSFRPSTAMLALAHVALNGTREDDREQAAQGLAAMVLEAAEAMPAPVPR